MSSPYAEPATPMTYTFALSLDGGITFTVRQTGLTPDAVNARLASLGSEPISFPRAEVMYWPIGSNMRYRFTPEPVAE